MLEEPKTRPIQNTVDTDTAIVIHLMLSHKNHNYSQILRMLAKWEFEIKSVGVTLVGDNTFEFSDWFTVFPTNPLVTNGDIEEDDRKIINFLPNIR